MPLNLSLGMLTIQLAWLGFNVSFDVALTWIPYTLVHRARLEGHKRTALLTVFGAGVLGTTFR
jgi:hypothetical protein